MQEKSLPESTMSSSASLPEPLSMVNTILHLQGIFPGEEVLAVNRELRTLSRLSMQGNFPRQIMEQQFAPSEMLVLLPLVEASPNCCSYEVLMASVVDEQLTVAGVAYYRQRLREARKLGGFQREVKPLHNLVSRIRFKLRFVGLEITTHLEKGYSLLAFQEEQLW